MLDAAIEATKNGSTVIVAGDRAATAVNWFEAKNKLSHVSTGRIASLELLEGKVRWFV